MWHTYMHTYIHVYIRTPLVTMTKSLPHWTARLFKRYSTDIGRYCVSDLTSSAVTPVGPDQSEWIFNTLNNTGLRFQSFQWNTFCSFKFRQSYLFCCSLDNEFGIQYDNFRVNWILLERQGLKEIDLFFILTYCAALARNMNSLLVLQREKEKRDKAKVCIG